MGLLNVERASISISGNKIQDKIDGWNRLLLKLRFDLPADRLIASYYLAKLIDLDD